MREIKFRGKRVDNGEWAYGYLYIHEPPLQCLQSDTSGKTKAYILKTGFADWNMTRPIDFVEVDIATAGQFTGLQDQNGVDIYDCDILAEKPLKPVASEFSARPNGVVQWSDYDYYNERKGNLGRWSLVLPLYEEALTNSFNYLVIGNTIDNPDMRLK